jgi:hypothetical protein
VPGRATRSLDVVMDTSRKVICSEHGPQDESFVCQHIVTSLYSGIAVGFHWPAESMQLHPDAWCTACEIRRASAPNGDWNDELNEMLGIKILCGACYERAKSIWQQGRKVEQ